MFVGLAHASIEFDTAKSTLIILAATGIHMAGDLFGWKAIGHASS